METMLTQRLATAESIVIEAGDIAKSYYQSTSNIELEIKEDGSPLTVADRLINSLIIQRLAEAFPQDGVIGEEESTVDYGNCNTWICDPIDGTRGFELGIGDFNVSLGFTQGGVALIGAIRDPKLDITYLASKNEFASRDGLPIGVSSTQDINDSRLAVTAGLANISVGDAIVRNLSRVTRSLYPTIGAVQMATRVAEGKLDGLVHARLQPYDVAAAHVLIESAGGKVTALDGSELNYSKPFRGVIMSNGLIHQQLIDQL